MQDQGRLVREIETIIARVQGVVSGRLICRNGEIVEIHVLADSTRSPKQVVRDIESTVLIKLGLELDHRKISVAQLDSDRVLPFNEEIRFQLRSINYKSENGNAEISVTISCGKKSYTALEGGPNTRQNRVRMAASATITAIEQCLNLEGTLVLGDVQKLVLCGQAAIATAVCLRSRYQEEILLGTSLNKGDDLESTVRSSLDAVNRRITIINDI